MRWEQVYNAIARYYLTNEEISLLNSINYYAVNSIKERCQFCNSRNDVELTSNGLQCDYCRSNL